LAAGFCVFLNLKTAAWSSRPSTYLLTINIVTIIAFAVLGVSGLILPAVSAGTALSILGIVTVCVLAIDFMKFYLFRRFHV
jgi:hypothetical protein